MCSEGVSESSRICLQSLKSRLCGGNGQVAGLALYNKGNRATPLFNYNHYLRRWEMPDLVGHDGKRVGSDNKTDGMNRHIYRLVAAVLAAMTIVSCIDARKSETFRVLEDVDSYIEARPDSALAVLEGIDKSKLTSKELEAKYALLLSQALDKNYIDLQSDSIIAPAVNYYKYHGTDDERFRTLYYAGRVYQNAGDIEAAMEKFVEAERYISSQIDKSVVARLYKAKMVAYRDVFDHQSALEQAKTAAEYYLAAKDSTRYLNAVNDIAVSYSLLEDKESEDKYLAILSSNMHLLTHMQISKYYGIQLNNSLQGPVENIQNTLKDYLAATPDESMINWICVADAYIALSDYQSALKSLDSHILYGGQKDLTYYWTAATLYEKLGRYKEALSLYKEYLYTSDHATLAAVESDTKFIEERHKKEIELLDAEHSKERITLISIIAILCAVIIIYLIRKQLQIRTAEKKQLEIEKKRYEQLYADAIAEREALTKMIEDSSVKDETKAVIRERLEVLNKVIISHITDTSSANKKAFQELEALISDRDSFIESTRLTIEGNNPGFITALREAGLTDEEINICCLYVIGLKGKDIKTYTNQSRLYIQSAEIRHKLGLTENDTNLSIHLRNMCENEVC